MSNKLLTGLLAIVLLAMLGSNLVLKAAYEKIDFTDAFYGYSEQAIKPFKVVKLMGNSNSLIQLQQGKDFEVRVAKEANKDIRWKQKGDTLELTIPPEGESFDPSFVLRRPPDVYIIAPSLEAVYANGIVSKLNSWNLPRLFIRQEGAKGTMVLTSNKIESLSVLLSQGGLLKAEKNNQVVKAAFQVQDSSSIIIEKDVFADIQMDMDSSAFIKVPGALLSKLRQK